MGFGVNLRFDLKFRRDKHLAALLERSWQRYEDAKAKAAPSRLLRSGRGLLRHPWAYSSLSVIDYDPNYLSQFGIAIECRVEGFFSSRASALMQMHLALCDIADIEDELHRRIQRRKRGWRR